MRGFLLALALAAAPTCAWAQEGFRVSPVIIQVPAERGVGSFRVFNGRARDAAFEVQAFAWRQENGETVLDPTETLIVAPSVFLVPAGGEQIVRLGVQAEARPSHGEASYRLIVRELPDAQASAAGFRLMVEMSLPVFVRARRAQGAFSVERARMPDGAPGVAFVNRGDAHVVLSMPEQTQAIVEAAPRYVLAGARVVRPLTQSVAAIRLVAAEAGEMAPQAQTFELIDAPVLADVR